MVELKARCRDHPRYRAIRYPTAKDRHTNNGARCWSCWWLYMAKTGSFMSSIASRAVGLEFVE